MRIQGEAGACGCEEGPPGKHREWLTGASGSGKTTLLRAVEAMEIPAVACFQCETIYDSLPEEVRADGEVAQDAILDYWVKLGGARNASARAAGATGTG